MASEQKQSLEETLSSLMPREAAASTGVKGKYLIDLVNRVGHKQAFFALWFLIVAVFVLLMVAFYRKQTRRNFKGPGPGDGNRNLPPLSKRGPG